MSSVQMITENNWKLKQWCSAGDDLRPRPRTVSQDRMQLLRQWENEQAQGTECPQTILGRIQLASQEVFPLSHRRKSMQRKIGIESLQKDMESTTKNKKYYRNTEKVQNGSVWRIR